MNMLPVFVSYIYATNDVLLFLTKKKSKKDYLEASIYNSPTLACLAFETEAHIWICTLLKVVLHYKAEISKFNSFRKRDNNWTKLEKVILNFFFHVVREG